MKKPVLFPALALFAASCAATFAADPPDGKALFQETCMKCHGDKGQGEPKALETICEGVAPEKLKLESSAKKTNDEMRKQILEGTEDMPAYKEKLSPEQVDALIAFVRTLFPESKDKK